MILNLRKSLIAGEEDNITDEALKVELQAIKYEIYGDKTMRVMGKEAIKKLLGHSPDRADALAYANWAMKHNFWFPDMWIPISAGT